MLSSQLVYSLEDDNNQYLKSTVVNNQREYLVGLLDRQTFYTTLRAEFFITPELSLQYYGSPYVSTGKFLDYRRVDDSKAIDLNTRFETLTRTDNGFLIDGDNNVYHDFSYYDFDFNFQEFRSNFVARWEYKTGSTIYFVWSHNRTAYEDVYNASLFDSLKGIGKLSGENAFMIKLSYWFSL